MKHYVELTDYGNGNAVYAPAHLFVDAVMRKGDGFTVISGQLTAMNMVVTETPEEIVAAIEMARRG